VSWRSRAVRTNPCRSSPQRDLWPTRHGRSVACSIVRTLER